ncbi:hypothetical protein [Sulfurimonas sp.]|uniref:hypothetical protein n=1 Tax=Sulfurimonas sp. TaxID=2022749 RepID=UPI0025D33FB7|nr:hypothetical protein [Sulfurimonas sp.]
MIFIEINIKEIIGIVFIIIEMFPIFYMFKALSLIMIRKIFITKEKILQRCTHDRKYRNRVASFLFFFADMGPNVSSFSVIAIFITTKENVWILIIVFLCGIIMKEIFREFKNKFYEAIEQRNSQ